VADVADVAGPIQQVGGAASPAGILPIQQVGGAASPAGILPPQPERIYRVEFWVLGGSSSPAGVAREWQLFNVRWVAQWNSIPEMVQEWEEMGGIWVRSQLRIEEYVRTGDRFYDPVNRM